MRYLVLPFVFLVACGPAPGSTTETDSTTGTGTGPGTEPTPTEASSTGGSADACASPEPILQSGSAVPTGFVRCADGFVHRVEPQVCAEPHGPGDCANPGVGCTEDSQCTDRAHGRCIQPGNNPDCECSYGCADDDDCPSGSICACAGEGLAPRATCIPASCTRDADCPAGSLCGVSRVTNACFVESLALGCVAASDCHVDEDCPDGPCYGPGSEPGKHRCGLDLDNNAWGCRPAPLCWGPQPCG